MKPLELKASATQKQDVRNLDRMTIATRAPVPPAARLTMAELYEVDRLAGIGANLFNIGIHLRKPDDVWQVIVERNPAVREAFLAGLNRLQIEGMEAIYHEAIVNRETSLLRLLADRKLGPDWAPPKQSPAVVVQSAQPVRIDVVSSVRGAFEEQRRLIEAETIEAGPDQEQPGPPS